MIGSAFSLARWFDETRYANRPEDDFIRENLLNDVENFTAVAVIDDGFIVRTPLGAATITQVSVPVPPSERVGGVVPVNLMNIDHVRNDQWERTGFWMNTSSVKNLLERLAAAPHVDANALFIGGAA